MNKKLQYGNSDELCTLIAERTNGKALLAFSAGKDSIAAYLQMKKYFNEIVLYYLYLIPGLEFVEKALIYYEKKFDVKILRLPNPRFYEMLNAGVFMPKGRRYTMANLRLPVFSNEDIQTGIKEDYFNSNYDLYTGIGIRENDNLVRRMCIKKTGAVNEKKKTFYPVYDWSNEKLRSEIEKAGISLSDDYRVWGCSFDGLHNKFLKGLKENYPADYEKCKYYFPLLDTELLRYKYREEYYAKY